MHLWKLRGSEEGKIDMTHDDALDVTLHLGQDGMVPNVDVRIQPSLSSSMLASWTCSIANADFKYTEPTDIATVSADAVFKSRLRG